MSTFDDIVDVVNALNEATGSKDDSVVEALYDIRDGVFYDPLDGYEALREALIDVYGKEKLGW